jgi:hypothetical protein
MAEGGWDDDTTMHYEHEDHLAEMKHQEELDAAIGNEHPEQHHEAAVSEEAMEEYHEDGEEPEPEPEPVRTAVQPSLRAATWSSLCVG